VIQAEEIENFGVVVRLKHGKTFETIYAHLSKLAVTKGAKVREGQIIAYSGNSGLSTGPHLHYDVIENGESVNPREFLAKK
jgi:murein DD-endopeptidase MepM/ murein hydrolase activator NlpD